jgi:hypothetical protein
MKWRRKYISTPVLEVVSVYAVITSHMHTSCSAIKIVIINNDIFQVIRPPEETRIPNIPKQISQNLLYNTVALISIARQRDAFLWKRMCRQQQKKFRSMQQKHKHTSITIEELLGHVFSMCFMWSMSSLYKANMWEISQCDSSASRKTPLYAVQ